MTEKRHTPASLAAKLDKTLPPHSSQTPTASDDPMVNAASWMASAPRPNLPARATADIQSQILQHAQQQSFDHRTLRPDFRPILRWALVASVILAIMATGVPATLASVPGDPLYPLKLTLEQVEVTLASSPQTRANLGLNHAERRLQETRTLLERGQFDAALINASLDNMADSAHIVRSTAGFSPDIIRELETRTIALNTTLAGVIAEASQLEGAIQSNAILLMTQVAATQASGALLLPPTETPMPTATATATETPTMTAAPTEAPDATATPAVLPVPELPIDLIIEGPIQSIDGNTVAIYDAEIELGSDDPLLRIIQIGDVLRVGGNITRTEGDTIIVTSVNAELADDTVAVGGDGQTVWRDSGGCDNPPPDWAAAHGWRARCENQARPGKGNPPGNNGRGNGSTNPGNPSPPGQGKK